jgi:soluble lytic murein transglycosylase
MTIDEAKEILEDAGYILEEGVISRALGAGALAAGLAFGNSGVKSKPVTDDSFGKGSVVHMQQRYNTDFDKFGVPKNYKASPEDSSKFTFKDEVELTKKKILATPDTMLKKYGRQNVTTIAKYMVNTANKYNIDIDILLAMAGTESNYDNTASSNKGARGMMQITKGTAFDTHTRLQGKDPKTFNFDDFNNLKFNIDNAGRIIANLSKSHKNVIEMMLADYNGGRQQSTNFRSYISKSKYDRDGRPAKPLAKETKNYIERCMSLYKIYKKVQKDYIKNKTL